MSREVRAYSRYERKRLIINVFAEEIRKGHPAQLTCAGLAQKMNIRPSTKLRKILAEMIEDELLRCVKEPNAGVCGFRMVYELNYWREGFSKPHENRRAVRRERNITLNINGKREAALL